MKFSLLTNEEIQLFRVRVALLGGALALVLAALVLRIWFLQVVDGAYYTEVAKGNRIRVVPQEAPRGLIYDRDGELLAYNRPAFNIQLIPEDTPDLETSLKNLSRLTGHPYRELQRTVRENRSRLKFKPVQLLEDIGRKTADLVDTYQEDLPGVTVAVESKRLYPNAYTTSHVVGYVGEINKAQLEQLPVNRVRSGRIVGHAGVEHVENGELIGVDGGRQVEVDHVGRELRVFGEPVDPVPGDDLYLSVDLELQQYVKNLMSGHTGTVIVMNPRTGEVLAMSSFPDFDPNLFVGGIEEQLWRQMTHGETKPLVNKATQGLYPPGSTFKMLIASAALDQGVIEPDTELECPGYYRVGRAIRYCWKRSGHGKLNVVEALAQSCNVFFYQLGVELGVERIREYGGMFGFGRPTGIELADEKGGLLPSKAWKRRVTGEQWYDGETVNIAIGQGFLTVTPLQLLNYVNVIANRGVWVQPTLVRRVVTPGEKVEVSPERLPRRTRLLPIPVEILDRVRAGMVRVVNGENGTGRRARSDRFTIAGKTGTAQVVASHRLPAQDDDGEDGEEVGKELKPHALFVGFAPAENPRISVMTLVEHGEAGGKVAAPLTRRVMEFYFREIQPLQSHRAKPSLADGGPAENGGLPYRERLTRAFRPAGGPAGRGAAP